MEDIAYCLLGIFQINMPLLHGEGKHSFTRLQEKIARHSDDQSLFAWSNLTSDTQSILAASPADFGESKDIVPCKSGSVKTGFFIFITNKGLEPTVPMFEQHALLECRRRGDLTSLVVVQFRKIQEDEHQRIPRSKLGMVLVEERTISLTQHSESQDDFPDLPRYTMFDGREFPYFISTSLPDVKISSSLIIQKHSSILRVAIEKALSQQSNTQTDPTVDVFFFAVNLLALVFSIVFGAPSSLKWGILIVFILRSIRLINGRHSVTRDSIPETHYDHILEIQGMSSAGLTLTMRKPHHRRLRCHVSLNQDGRIPESQSSFLTPWSSFPSKTIHPPCIQPTARRCRNSRIFRLAKSSHTQNYRRTTRQNTLQTRIQKHNRTLLRSPPPYPHHIPRLRHTSQLPNPFLICNVTCHIMDCHSIRSIFSSLNGFCVCDSDDVQPVMVSSHPQA